MGRRVIPTLLLLLASAVLLGAAPGDDALSNRLLVRRFTGEEMSMEVLAYRRLSDDGSVAGTGLLTTTADGSELFEDGEGRVVFQATVNLEARTVSGHAYFEYAGDVQDGTDLFVSEGRGRMDFVGYAGEIADGTDIFKIDIIADGQYMGDVADGTDI